MTSRQIQDAFLRALSLRAPEPTRVYIDPGEGPGVDPGEGVADEQWWALLVLESSRGLRRHVRRAARVRADARILVERGDSAPRRVRDWFGPAAYVGAEYILGPGLDPLSLSAIRSALNKR